MSRAWDFGYAPVTPAAALPEPAHALVVAAASPVDAAAVAAAAGAGARAEPMLSHAPIFWIRLVLAAPELPDAVAARLITGGVPVRYVASAERPSLALGAPLPLAGAPVARADAWPVARRTAAVSLDAPTSAGTWFLRDGEGGVAVDRALGGGAGTRLAVIDDEALEADALELDDLVLVELDQRPASTIHGALMVAWASGARGFAGVAPEASRRLYVIPKPGRSATALPLAIARAVLDGADVIVCATYVEGSQSPMLDDALELAARLGRRGRGTAVVMPTGREASSPPGSLHASFSLGLGEPASDPRVFCVAPGGRGGGWFLWRARGGRLRPFANRGPAVRWLAPGDNLAYPFSPPGAPERLFHAESSGASAVAAGVLLLVIAASPRLRLAELAAVVDATLAPVPAEPPGNRGSLADAADLLPHAADRDGHDAKHGHGLLQAGRACLAAADPVCGALLAMGEDAAARRYARLRRRRAVAGAYSRRLGRWAVRALLADPEAAEALRVILRHLRLTAGREDRLRAHGDGALLRRIQLLVRRLAAARVRPGAAVRAELAAIERRLWAIGSDVGRAARFEHALARMAAGAFAAGAA